MNKISNKTKISILAGILLLIGVPSLLGSNLESIVILISVSLFYSGVLYFMIKHNEYKKRRRVKK